MACLRYYLSPEGKAKLETFRRYVRQAQIKRLIMIGHSYNFFATNVPYYYVQARNKAQKQKNPQFIPVECMRLETDEFMQFFNPFRFGEKTMYIFISKTGSVQTLDALDKLSRAGISTGQIGILSNNSDLESRCGFFFPIVSGEEEVIGTKSYVNAILTLYFLIRAAMDEDSIPRQVEDEVRQLIFEIKFYGQDWEFHVKSLNDFLGVNYDFLYFISKGSSMATAHQAALNCKSYTHTYGEGSNIGLFLHGPFKIVNDMFRSILIIGDESNFDDTVKLIELVSKRLGSGKVILINNSRQLSSMGRANNNVWVFEHTTKNPYLAPIFEIVVLLYLFVDQALRRGVIR